MYYTITGLFFGRFFGNSAQLELPVLEFFGNMRLSFLRFSLSFEFFWPKILKFFG